MVLDAQQQQRNPVVRGFLGKLVRGNDRGEREVAPDGVFFSVPGSSPLPIGMDSEGARHPFLNIRSAAENKFSVPKNPERYMEGCAETFGLSCPKQWPRTITSCNTRCCFFENARLEGYAKPSAMQLTIFYGGHVNVYNNIPVERAEAIMQFASTGDFLSSSIPTLPCKMSHSPGLCQAPTAAEHVHGTGQILAPVLFAADQASQNRSLECAIPNDPSTATSPQPVVPRALPLARKASLARFLEKRKERMQMMSPYFKKQVAPVAPGEQMLGLVPNASLPGPHSQYCIRPPVLFRMQEHIDP